MALSLKLYQKSSLATLEKFLELARVHGPESAFGSAAQGGLVTTYKPLPGLVAVPYACLRIPTGGGKTVMGAHIIQIAGRTTMEREYPLVLWMVPTNQIKSQTLAAFRTPRHPYRQELDDAFGGQVAVFDVADFTQIRPSDISTKVCLIVSTVASLRVDDTLGRKVYQHHEELETHFGGAIGDLPYLNRDECTGKAIASFANLLRLHGPLVVMDEAHNANTPLSYDVYERLNPKAVVELTATPDASSSNILVSVSAFELKAENMIKFPVLLKEHSDDWRVAVSAAVARRNTLASTAVDEPEYIRPILLIQAENRSGAATVAEVKKFLIESECIGEQRIAVATGDMRGLDGVDLFSRECPIEVVITKQALKEGWDCSFAYVFCSVAQVKSEKDVQQLLGRVLRMPYALPRKDGSLNKAYAHVVSKEFGLAAFELTQSLVAMGFNPLEARRALQAEQKSLGLEETDPPPRVVPRIVLETTRAPNLGGLWPDELERTSVTPKDGGGFVVEIVGEVSTRVLGAVEASVSRQERRRITEILEQHNERALAFQAAMAPSERGQTFEVPRLYIQEVQGELDLVESQHRSSLFSWDLRDSPADLDTFQFNENSMTFEVFLDGLAVQYHPITDDVLTYLPGFSAERTEADLVGWLDSEIRAVDVLQSVKREWIRRAIVGLVKQRNFSLSQLMKGQFVLRRKLMEQLDIARAKAHRTGFQDALFGSEELVVASAEPGYAFVFPADMTMYPAKAYCESNSISLAPRPIGPASKTHCLEAKSW